MNYSKILIYTTSLAAGLLMSGITHADNCYDPDNNTYFACNVDDGGYATPVEEAVVLGAVAGAAVAVGENGYYNHNNGYYNNNYHGNYNNGGNHGNFNGGGNGGWHR